MKSFISINDLDREEIMDIINLAHEIETNPQNKRQNKILSSIFFEPSTRTKLSFTTAAIKSGFEVIDLGAVEGSSLQKGESLRDTIKMFSIYSDIIVMRHNIEGAARFASEMSDVPIINGGDGSNEHPTQTLLDLYTIWKQFKNLDNLKVAIVGDLKYGRTVHSLVKAMKLFNAEFYFIAHDLCQIPNQIIDELERSKVKYKKIKTISEVISEVDVLYMTRIQRERFSDAEEYNRTAGLYTINHDNIVGKAKDSMIILHPLPRVDEINIDLDDTKHALYFKQAANGVPIRMALIELALSPTSKDKTFNDLTPSKTVQCHNPKCICNKEETSNLTYKENNTVYCYYCGTDLMEKK